MGMASNTHITAAAPFMGAKTKVEAPSSNNHVRVAYLTIELHPALFINGQYAGKKKE
jgi:hypothetical protein